MKNKLKLIKKKKIHKKILIYDLMMFNIFCVKMCYLNLYQISQYSVFDDFVFLKTFCLTIPITNEYKKAKVIIITLKLLTIVQNEVYN